jgi:predicted RNA binding protein YcfA (HicA-like mRNA interferase family)
LSELSPTKPDKVAWILERLDVLRMYGDTVSNLTEELHRGILSEEFYRNELADAKEKLDEAIAKAEREHTTATGKSSASYELGFTCIRQSGSHMIFHHPDGRWTTVPIHKGRDLGKGILGKILKDAKITFDEFEQMH